MTMSASSLLASATDDGFAKGTGGIHWLPEAINIALHLFLVGSFAAFAYGLVVLVRERKDQMVGRSMALFVGALVVVGAQASGRSYADFIIGALGESRSPLFGFFGAVLPAAAGLALGYYFTRGARRSSERAIRGMIMVGTFAITQFALMYAIAVEQNGRDLDAAVTPNVAFVAGLGLWLVMNLGIKAEPTDADGKPGVLGALAERIGGRSKKADEAPLGGSPLRNQSRFHDKD